jgi:hypothetical protein
MNRPSSARRYALSGTNTSRWRTVLLAVVGSLAVSACSVGSNGIPSIVVTPAEVQSGASVRVSGKGWRAGEKLTVALSVPDGRPQDGRLVTTGLCDASGQFVALFPFPTDATWSGLTEIWVWAYGQDLARVAHTSVSYAQPATSTPTRMSSATAPSPTPTAQPTATLTPTKAAPAWRGQYYRNTTLSGGPALVRDDPQIDFRWGDGTPAEGLPTDDFAVRWTGAWPFQAGAYRFYVQLQDGVRIWLDEHLIIDQWHEGSGALYSADAYLETASHMLRVEYFSGHAAATVRFWWEGLGPDAILTYPDWKGEYFANASLAGAPYLVVNDRSLDFDWSTGPPATGMPADNFSVRWTRSLNLDAGTYRFHARSDDGVRVWVDDRVLIDQWKDGAAETYWGDLDLTRGSHRIRVEYYEHAGLAVIQVGWELLPNTSTPTVSPTSLPATQTPVPTETLLPSTATPMPPTPSPTASLTPAPGVQSAFSMHIPLAFRISGQAPLRQIRRGYAGGPMAEP